MEWIKCSDRLPENDETVLICLHGQFLISFRQYYPWGERTDSKVWWSEKNNFAKTTIPTICDCCVTHWMPLPQPPKDKDK